MNRMIECPSCNAVLEIEDAENATPQTCMQCPLCGKYFAYEKADDAKTRQKEDMDAHKEDGRCTEDRQPHSAAEERQRPRLSRAVSPPCGAEDDAQATKQDGNPDVPLFAHLLNIDGGLCTVAAVVLLFCAMNTALPDSDRWTMGMWCAALTASALLSFALAQLSMMFAALVRDASRQVSLLKEIKDAIEKRHGHEEAERP